MEILNNNDLTEYEEFVKGHRAGSFMQSVRWTKVKFNWEHEYIVSRDAEGKIVGAMLILVRKIPLFNTCLLYAPRGPVCQLHDRKVLEDLLEGVKAVAKKYHAYLFRMDPYVLAQDEDFIDMARDIGFEFTPGAKDFETFQTRNNYMLPLEGKTEEEVFAGFHSKWRYNIRVALKHGVECRVCDKTHVDEFYQLMKVTGDRDGFIIRPKDYFVRMLDELGEHARLYLCFYQGKAISGALTTQYAGKTCYVYGASDNSNRRVMPNYLMQWEMIKWAIESGCFVYDFQGIPHYQDEDHPNYGVYRFKKGFNGQVVEFAGEFDFVFSKTMKKIVDMGEKGLKYARTLQKKLTTTGRSSLNQGGPARNPESSKE